MSLRRQGCLLALAIGLCLLPLPTRAQTPEAVLRNVQTALDNSDVALFERFVDLDALISQAVDTFLEEAATPAGRAALPPVAAMLLSSIADSESDSSARALLRHEMRQFVRYGIRSGAFAGRKSQAPPSALFSGSVSAPLFGDVSLGRKELRDIRRAVPDGRDMRIAFTVLDHGNGNVYPVMARLSPMDTDWRIVAVTNMRTLVHQILQEASR